MNIRKWKNGIWKMDIRKRKMEIKIGKLENEKWKMGNGKIEIKNKKMDIRKWQAFNLYL